MRSVHTMGSAQSKRSPPPNPASSASLALSGNPADPFPLACTDRIHLPAPLRSTRITRLHRYYERSDFCRCHHQRQVSLIHVPSLPDHSVSNHLACPSVAFARYPSARWASRCLLWFPVACTRRLSHKPGPGTYTLPPPPHPVWA